jgi:hypothetical protein
MKRISSYFALTGEKRAKPTTTDENQNEAISTNLENPSESGTEGQKKNESSGSAGVPAPRKFQQQWSTDTKYKEWLQYDANKQHMTCSFCIKTNKQNPSLCVCCLLNIITITLCLLSSEYYYHHFVSVVF